MDSGHSNKTKWPNQCMHAYGGSAGAPPPPGDAFGKINLGKLFVEAFGKQGKRLGSPALRQSHRGKISSIRCLRYWKIRAKARLTNNRRASCPKGPNVRHGCRLSINCIYNSRPVHCSAEWSLSPRDPNRFPKPGCEVVLGYSDGESMLLIRVQCWGQREGRGLVPCLAFHLA